MFNLHESKTQINPTGCVVEFFFILGNNSNHIKLLI